MMARSVRELAQHQNADHVDDIESAAEFAEMEKPCCADSADQEGDQHNNRLIACQPTLWS